MKKMDFMNLLKDIIKGDKKKKLLISLLFLGMALILFSEIKLPKKETNVSQPLTNLEYTQYIENKLCEMVESIDGVDKSKVMVTLENGAEYVYANETNVKRDRTEDMGDKTVKEEQSVSSQNKFILVESDNGRKTALVQTQIEPVIKGVAIICNGRGGAVVEKNITDTITTVLGIGANQVSIADLKD